MQTLHTDRLLIRSLHTDDAEFILGLLNEPSFIQNIGDRHVRNLEDARAYILNGPVTSYTKNGFGLNLVTLKETGEAMGMCGLIRRDTLEDVDLGYAYLPRYWSKGYAVEAGKATLEFGWNVVKLNRVVAITDPANHPSIHVLSKLGFTFEKMVRLSADDIELNLYGISKPVA